MSFINNNEWFTYPKSKIILFREDGELYLTICRSPMTALERRKLLRIVLYLDNKTLDITEMKTDAGKMTLTTNAGTIEFAFEGESCLRIRGTGRVSLKFRADGLREFENGAPREDGGIEAAFIMMGKLLFTPLKGALWHDAKWIPSKAKSEDFSIILLPSIESGGFECAVHEYFSNGVSYETYAPFDECVKKAEREFLIFESPTYIFKNDKLTSWRNKSENGFFQNKLRSVREFEGYAADFLLKRTSNIRHRMLGDFPVYYHVNETGFPELADFPAGVPVKAPDLLTWLALRTDSPDSERYVAMLLSDLWRGERFVFINAKTGEECNANSPLRFVPLLLGGRLPPDVFTAVKTDAVKNELPEHLAMLLDY